MDYTRVIGEETDKTVATLNQLFEMMGSSSSEIESELISLNNNVAMVFQSALEKAHTVKKELLAHMTASHEFIHHVANQLGEPNIVDKWNDVQTDTTLTLRVRATQIDKIVEAAKQKRDLRYSVMSGYASQLSTLYPLLGITSLPTMIEPRIRRASLDTIHDIHMTCLTSERQISMEQEITGLEQIKLDRIVICHQWIIKIIELWEELGISEQEMTCDSLNTTIYQYYYRKHISDIPTSIIISNIGLSMIVLGELEHRYKTLVSEKQNRILQRESILKEIIALWDRCSISQQERDGFLNANQTLKNQFLQGYTTELNRMQSVKQSMMSHLIENVRDDIRKIWKQLRYTDNEMSSFQPFYVSIFTDQALSCHEQELSRLQTIYQTMSPILALVDKREHMRHEITEYELWLQDPENQNNRLNSRHSFRILAKEEELRKMQSNILPKLDTKILNALSGWEKQHNQVFKVDGESYVQVIKNQQQETQGIQMAKKKMEDDNRLAKKSGRLSEAIPSTTRMDTAKPNIYATMPSPNKLRNLSVYDVTTCTKPVSRESTPIKTPREKVITPTAAPVIASVKTQSVKNKENTPITAPITPVKSKKETSTTDKQPKKHVGTPFGMNTVNKQNKTPAVEPVKPIKNIKVKPAVPIFAATPSIAPTTPKKSSIPVKPVSKLKPKYATASVTELKHALSTQSISTATTPKKTAPKKRKSTSAPTSPQQKPIHAVDDMILTKSSSTSSIPAPAFRKMSFAANFSSLSQELKRKTEQGKLLYARGSYQEALQLFTYVIDHAPTSTDLRDILHSRAHVYTKLHQYAEAMADSDRACSFVQQLTSNESFEQQPLLTNTDIDLEMDAVNRSILV